MSKKRLFARFQGSEKIEHKSRFTLDIFDIYESKLSLKEALIRHGKTLNMRPDITAEELAIKVLNCKTDTKKDGLIDKYPLDGVFAYDINYFKNKGEIENVQDMIKLSGFYEIALKHKFLVVMEGKEKEDFDEGSILIQPTKIIETYDMYEMIASEIRSYNNLIKRFKNINFLIKNNITLQKPNDNEDLYSCYINLLEILEEIIHFSSI